MFGAADADSAYRQGRARRLWTGVGRFSPAGADQLAGEERISWLGRRGSVAEEQISRHKGQSVRHAVRASLSDQIVSAMMIKSEAGCDHHFSANRSRNQPLFCLLVR